MALARRNECLRGHFVRTGDGRDAQGRNTPEQGQLAPDPLVVRQCQNGLRRAEVGDPAGGEGWGLKG